MLQEREVEPRRRRAHAQVDVRVVAATNRDLKRAMAEGHASARISTTGSPSSASTLPPLRERREDISPLVRALSCAATASARTSAAAGSRAEARRPAARAHAWPGNVRELANVIERALILSDGPDLHLDAAFGRSKGHHDPGERLDEVERAHLLRVLERCQWRISGAGNAAELLGLRPSTLRSRLKKLGVARPKSLAPS